MRREFTEKDAAALFPPRDRDAHKGVYGYTALIGGSPRYTGAIRLAAMAEAAVRSGAGVVKAAFPKGLYHEIVPSLLESTAFPLKDRDGEIVFCEDELRELTGNTKSCAFGMGIGTGEGAKESLKWLIRNYPGRLIIDADGLNLLSREGREILREKAGMIILTPHVKEFSRLTGAEILEIQERREEMTAEYARETGTIVLLKGTETVITDGADVLISATGCPGMATGGSGDVLSGILAALLGFAKNPLTATAAGAWINGRAGENAARRINEYSMTASDTAKEIAGVISELIRVRDA